MPEQVESLQNATKAYDKLLITLAGGGLTLTVGFVKDVIDLRQASGEILLIFSWISFALALFLTLFNYYISIDILAKEAEEALKPEADRKPITYRHHHLRRHAVTAYGSLFLFAIGIMFLIWFLAENILNAAVAPASATR